MTDQPCWTVVTATFNAENHLPDLYASINKQVIPPGAVKPEVIVVDGGSSDNTIQLAKSLGLKVVSNLAGDVVTGKLMGLQRAKSDKVCFIDQDERLVSEKSLLEKASLIDNNPFVIGAIGSGYVVNPSISSAKNYVSEFGDPVSAVLYGLPNSDGRREAILKRRLRWRSPKCEWIIFNNVKPSLRVLIEFPVQGGMISRSRFQSFVGSGSVAESQPISLSELFGQARESGKYFEFGLVVGDAVEHYPSNSWRVIFNKVRWRILNGLGKGESAVERYGIRGRLHAHLGMRSKVLEFAAAALFILYVALVVPVVVHACWLATTRRQKGLLMHVPLSFFVLWTVANVKAQSLVKKDLEVRRYDGTAKSPARI